MPNTSHESRSKDRYERVIFTLPPELMAEARRFAGAFHRGNNSGFVAAAIRSYIDFLQKSRHTAKLRESYEASAADSRKIAEDWDPLSAEAWQQLDVPKRTRRRSRTKER